MKLKHGIGWLLWVGLLIAANSQAVAADGSCDSYTWNVSKERALFAAPPTVVVASTEMNGAPRVRTGQLYELHLSLAPQIGELPGEAPRPAKYVGLVSVQIATSGRYRIALDNNAWVGMVSGISEEIPRASRGKSHAPRRASWSNSICRQGRLTSCRSVFPRPPPCASQSLRLRPARQDPIEWGRDSDRIDPAPVLRQGDIWRS